MQQINEEEWCDSDYDCFDDDQDGNLDDFSKLQDHLDVAGAGNDDDDDDDDDGDDGDDDGDDDVDDDDGDDDDETTMIMMMMMRLLGISLRIALIF